MSVPESSIEQDSNPNPNPMQTPENTSVFEKVMADIESNDDIDEVMIREATGAADIVPERTEQTEEDAPEEETPEEAETEETTTEEDSDAPPPEDSMDRLRRLAERGRQIGSRAHQLQQREAEFERKATEFQQRESAYAEKMKQLEEQIAAFERDPIEAYRMRGADPVKIGKRVKSLLENREQTFVNDETGALKAHIQKLEARLDERDQQMTQREQAMRQAEAAEQGHKALKEFISGDASKKAYPLASRLDEGVFRQYSSGAVDQLLQAGIPLSYDSICEVIEASLEAMRPVFGESSTPATERSARPTQASPPSGHRSAPSIGNSDKTSSGVGPDWDSLSLEDDPKVFADAIKREVASS